MKFHTELRIFIIAIFILIPLFIFAQKQKLAFFVLNNKYQHNFEELYGVKQSEELAVSFHNKGFDTLKLKNTTKGHFIKNINTIDFKNVGSFVYYYFGHIIQVNDADGDEINDAFDEVYTFCNSNLNDTTQFKTLLPDDEFHQILNRIRLDIGSTGQVMAIIQGCHSAGALRGTSVRYNNDLKNDKNRASVFFIASVPETLEDKTTQNIRPLSTSLSKIIQQVNFPVRCDDLHHWLSEYYTYMYNINNNFFVQCGAESYRSTNKKENIEILAKNNTQLLIKKGTLDGLNFSTPFFCQTKNEHNIQTGKLSYINPLYAVVEFESTDNLLENSVHLPFIKASDNTAKVNEIVNRPFDDSEAINLEFIHIKNNKPGEARNTFHVGDTCLFQYINNTGTELNLQLISIADDNSYYFLEKQSIEPNTVYLDNSLRIMGPGDETYVIVAMKSVLQNSDDLKGNFFVRKVELIVAP